MIDPNFANSLLTPFVLGVISLFMIISMALFLIDKDLNKKRDLTYLYYGGYCLNMFLLFLRNYLIEGGIINNASENLKGMVYLNLIFQTTPILFYGGFVYHVVDDVPEQEASRKLLKKFLKIVFGFLISYNIVFFIYIAFFGLDPLIFGALKVYPPITIGLGFLAIFVFFTRVKSDIIEYIIIGSICIATGAALSKFMGETFNFEIYQTGEYNIQIKMGKATSLQPWFQIGTTLDIIIIAIALFKRIVSKTRAVKLLPASNGLSLKKQTNEFNQDTITILNGNKLSLDKIIKIGRGKSRYYYIIFWYTGTNIRKNFIPEDKIAQDIITAKNVEEVMNLLQNDINRFYLARYKKPFLIISRNFYSHSQIKIGKKKKWIAHLKDGSDVEIPENNSKSFKEWEKKIPLNAAEN